MPLEEALDKAQSEINKAIKKKMIDKGFTQVELAKMLNVGRSSINVAISGASNPQAVRLRKQIYKILGMEE